MNKNHRISLFVRIFRQYLFRGSLLLFFALVSCNKGDKTTETDKDSFFGDLFSSQSLKDISTEDVKTALDSAKTGENLVSAAQVEEFYQQRDFSPAWESSDVDALLDAFSQADSEGLSPEDYHGNRLESLREGARESSSDRALLEILLTDALYNFAHDLYFGKVDPKELHGIWDVKKEDIDLNQVLEEAAETGELQTLFSRLRPQHPIYQSLIDALAEHREAMKEKEDPFNKIPLGDVIEQGEEDDRIPAIAERLKQLGFLGEDYSAEGKTYTEEMAKAVKEFQDQKSMQKDGILGNSTFKELNMTQEDRYDQLLVNLERWRWYPRDLGSHYILINIPQYKLAVVKEGDTIREHNIISGTKARPTPIFSDSLQHIVINPTWTIPRTIKAQDVIPKAAQDPSYITRSDMYVSNAEGKVDPHSIDWSSPEAQSYTITQRAGPSNPLGRVKIMYPNQYAIYLHDTPAQALFQQSERASSSGCVRVEDAVDLAAYVINDQEAWDLEALEESISTGGTKQVKITKPIRVHHFYWTAWRDSGKTVFTEDVYGLDKKIAEALKAAD